jgi:hypothetical protein
MMNSIYKILLPCTIGVSSPQMHGGMVFMPKQGGFHGIPGQT